MEKTNYIVGFIDENNNYRLSDAKIIDAGNYNDATIFCNNSGAVILGYKTYGSDTFADSILLFSKYISDIYRLKKEDKFPIDINKDASKISWIK